MFQVYRKQAETSIHVFGNKRDVKGEGEEVGGVIHAGSGTSCRQIVHNKLLSYLGTVEATSDFCCFVA